MSKNKKVKIKSDNKYKIGMPPGASVYVGVERDSPGVMDLISFDIDQVSFYNNFRVEDLHSLDTDKVHWLNVNGIHNVNMVNKVCQYFDIHPLTIEDILNTLSRPKCELHENYISSSLKMIKNELPDVLIEDEHVTIVLVKNFVILFQEQDGDVFEIIRSRLKNPNSRVRRKKSDYLFFLLHDVIVDNYLLISDTIDTINDDLETEIMNNCNDTVMVKLQSIKKDLLYMKKNVHPLRESTAKILRSGTKLIDNDNLKYFNDLNDHILTSVESIDNQTETAKNHLGLYMSMTSLSMNNVMKVLTIISSIFIPLTFIAGVYGMNFDNMPELRWKFGYFIILGAMFIIFLLMILYFRAKKWL